MLSSKIQNFIRNSKFKGQENSYIPVKKKSMNQSPSQLPQNNLSQINKVKTFILKTNIPTKEMKKTLKRGKLTVFTL